MLIHRQKHLNLFKYWLITSISLVVIMILVGGLTRLTNSGLSITEWELFKGLLPPLSSSEWIYYFDLYKKIPEYKLQNFKIYASDISKKAVMTAIKGNYSIYRKDEQKTKNDRFTA